MVPEQESHLLCHLCIVSFRLDIFHRKQSLKIAPRLPRRITEMNLIFLVFGLLASITCSTCSHDQNDDGQQIIQCMDENGKLRPVRRDSRTFQIQVLKRPKSRIDVVLKAAKRRLYFSSPLTRTSIMFLAETGLFYVPVLIFWPSNLFFSSFAYFCARFLVSIWYKRVILGWSITAVMHQLAAHFTSLR